MADVAVVILNYNGAKYLEKFLPAVIEYSKEAQIYVVDNNSNDDSIQLLRDQFNQVNLIEFEVNHGFTRGYNLALQQIQSEYYVLLNSDVEVTEHWIEPIVHFMNANPEVAACQPKVLAYHSRDHFEYAGAAGGFIDILGYPYCRGRIFETLEQDDGQYNDIKQVFWASGCCLFIRSSVFHELDGFRQEFFAHMEEIDLCWRINLTGRKVFCIPESHVYHVGGGTLAKSNPRKTYLNFRNNLAMLFINGRIRENIWKIPIKVIFDWLAAIKFWRENSFAHFAAVFQSHFDTCQT